MPAREEGIGNFQSYRKWMSLRPMTGALRQQPAPGVNWRKFAAIFGRLATSISIII